MLILSRKAGDAIVIDGGIRIVVVQCERGTVRIGIEAPAEVTILRAELLEQVAAQNRKSSAGGHQVTPSQISGGLLAPRRTLSVTPDA